MQGGAQLQIINLQGGAQISHSNMNFYIAKNIKHVLNALLTLNALQKEMSEVENKNAVSHWYSPINQLKFEVCKNKNGKININDYLYSL